MYRPHPDCETLFAGNPSSLVAATENVQAVRFDDLLEMRQVVWDLAKLIADWKPDLIPFPSCPFEIRLLAAPWKRPGDG